MYIGGILGIEPVVCFYCGKKSSTHHWRWRCPRCKGYRGYLEKLVMTTGKEGEVTHHWKKELREFEAPDSKDLCPTCKRPKTVY